MPGRRHSGTGLGDRSGKKRPAARPLSPGGKAAGWEPLRRLSPHRPGLGTRSVPPGLRMRHCSAHPFPGAQVAQQKKEPAPEGAPCPDWDFRSKAAGRLDVPVRFVRPARADPQRGAGTSNWFHPDSPREIQVEPASLPLQDLPADRADLPAVGDKSRQARLHKADRTQAGRTDRTVLPEAYKAARTVSAGTGADSPSARFDRFAPCGSLPFTCRKDGIASIGIDNCLQTRRVTRAVSRPFS